MQLRASRQPINAGPGGRCCRLRVFICRGYKGHVPELSLVFGATGLDGGQLSLSSIAVISSSERLQLVFEGLTKPLAHKGAKVIHQGIASSEEWSSLPRPGLPEIEARVDSVAATWMVCSGSVLRCLHCKMTGAWWCATKLWSWSKAGYATPVAFLKPAM